MLALLCDSTNAERPGITKSERTVGKTFDSIFADNKDNRIIVATFASNVDRVQQIINSAYTYGRKVIVEGRSMVSVINTAAELGIINIPDNTLIDIEQINDYPEEKTVIVTTGSQGETMAALSRIATNTHRKVSLNQGDVVIFSSNPIPGNEKAVSKVINELSMKGADVIFQDAHVSGHACEEEIKLIYSLVKPKYSIPVHGEYRHLKAQARIAKSLGIEKENIFILKTGQVLEIDSESAIITEEVENGSVFVDGLLVGDVGNVVIRDRQRLSEDGIIIIMLAMDESGEYVISGPVIDSRGFVYIKESDELIEEARQLACDELYDCLDKGVTGRNKIKNVLRDALGSFVWKKTKRKPIILVEIL